MFVIDAVVIKIFLLQVPNYLLEMVLFTSGSLKANQLCFLHRNVQQDADCTYIYQTCWYMAVVQNE